MKLINKIDKTALLALSAPLGFVLTSIALHYAFKIFAVQPKVLIVFGLPLAAIFGSFAGSLICQRLLKTNASILRLNIGAILGYELGMSLEFLVLYLQKTAFTKDIIFFWSLIVLMCGYLGALVGQQVSFRLRGIKQNAGTARG